MPFSKLKGKNLMLTDMLYQPANKLNDYKDRLNVIYKDLDTGEKKLMVVKEPETSIYIVKPEYRNFRKARHSLEKHMVEERVVKYKDVMYEIAKAQGEEEAKEFRRLDWRSKKQVYKYPYVLGGDIDVETVYRYKWHKQLGNDLRKPVTKLYADIETDQKYYEGAMAKHGEVPVNAISAVDEESMTVYTLLLNDVRNPQIAPFIENIDAFTKELHNDFDETYGVMDYKIFMFDSEAELIKTFFRLVNSLKRDFCMFWNMAFDAIYLRDRLIELGENPAEVICHPDFEYPLSYYYEDNDPKYFSFATKRDFWDVATYTHYVDQLIVYASGRKSQGTVGNVSLGAVAKKILKDDKLDYGESANIRSFAWDDYWLFTKYGIKDVLLQFGIESKTKDMDTLWMTSYNNYIAYKGVFKQTVNFRAFMYGELMDMGLVLGHNVNFDNYRDKDSVEDDDQEDGYAGALNGDPLLNSYNGLPIYGVPSMYLFANNIDFDFSAINLGGFTW